MSFCRHLNFIIIAQSLSNHHLVNRPGYHNIHWDSCHLARTYPIVC